MAISLGFLISDTLDQKILASHMNDLSGDTQVMGLMTIPRCSVIPMVLLDGS